MTDLLNTLPPDYLPTRRSPRPEPTNPRTGLHLVPWPTPVRDLDVVVPAYNEEARIVPTLKHLSAILEEAGIDARILLVDNGSVDATVDTVAAVRTSRVPVEVVNCRRQGKGAAVRAGVELAEAAHVAYIDADTSTPAQALVAAVGLLDHGWDGVIGSRRAFGGRYVVPQSRLRRVGSRAFNLAASGIVGRISDTQCGMKAFRTAAAKEIFAATTTAGFAFDVEVLARARAAGMRLMELPVEWTDAEGSTFSPLRHGTAAFRDLAAVRRATRDLATGGRR